MEYLLLYERETNLLLPRIKGQPQMDGIISVGIKYFEYPLHVMVQPRMFDITKNIKNEITNK
jgi:hypothetical protein